MNILDQEAADRENAQTVNMEAMKNFRFIQNFRDEFLELGEKEKRSVFSWENLNVSIITNSDYIMEKMLKETGLAISAAVIFQMIKGSKQKAFRWNSKRIRWFSDTSEERMTKRMS